MGYLRATEAATVMTDMVGLDAALHYHLTANHFPPIPAEMVSVAKAAIEAATDGDYERAIELPGGITYRDGATEVAALAVIESLHLEPFVDAALTPDEEVWA